MTVKIYSGMTKKYDIMNIIIIITVNVSEGVINKLYNDYGQMICRFMARFHHATKR